MRLRLSLLLSCAAASQLHAAAEQGDTAALAAALAAGADPNEADEDSYTPLHLSAGMGAVGALSVLLADARTDVDAVDDVGESPLHLAAAAGRTEAVRTLLAHGVHVDAPSREGYTALHMAAQHGNLAAAQLLLGAGFSPRAETYEGATPLHWAASASGSERTKHAEVFMLLLSKGGALNGKDDSGATPLSLVSERGSPQFKEQLQRWVAAERARRAEAEAAPSTREEL
jgi:ankyrin